MASEVAAIVADDDDDDDESGTAVIPEGVAVVDAIVADGWVSVAAARCLPLSKLLTGTGPFFLPWRRRIQTDSQWPSFSHHLHLSVL